MNISAPLNKFDLCIIPSDSPHTASSATRTLILDHSVAVYHIDLSHYQSLITLDKSCYRTFIIYIQRQNNESGRQSNMSRSAYKMLLQNKTTRR